MDINSVISDLQSNLTALQTDAASVKITLDSACYGSVMGPAAKAAGMPASELASMIADDTGLSDSLEGLDQSQTASARVAIRKLMDNYATQVANAAASYVVEHYESNMLKPSLASARLMSNKLRELGAKAGEIASQAARLDPKTNNRDATLNLQAAFSKQV